MHQRYLAVKKGDKRIMHRLVIRRGFRFQAEWPYRGNSWTHQTMRRMNMKEYMHYLGKKYVFPQFNI